MAIRLKVRVVLDEPPTAAAKLTGLGLGTGVEASDRGGGGTARAASSGVWDDFPVSDGVVSAAVEC